LLQGSAGGTEPRKGPQAGPSLRTLAKPKIRKRVKPYTS